MPLLISDLVFRKAQCRENTAIHIDVIQEYLVEAALTMPYRQNIPIFYDVFLSLQSPLSGFFRLGK